MPSVIVQLPCTVEEAATVAAGADAAGANAAGASATVAATADASRNIYIYIYIYIYYTRYILFIRVFIRSTGAVLVQDLFKAVKTKWFATVRIPSGFYRTEPNRTAPHSTYTESMPRFGPTP